MDEMYIKAKGQWKYYYRAVDKQGETIDFLLMATRGKRAAYGFSARRLVKRVTPV